MCIRDRVGIVGADLLDETAVAGEAAVSNNNTIEGSPSVPAL